MSKIVKYGAVGEEGCEFMARTQVAVKQWIEQQIEDEDMPVDYYYIHAYTKEDLAEMREV